MNVNISDLGLFKIPSQFKVPKSKLNFLLLNLKKYSFSQLDLETLSKNYKEISFFKQKKLCTRTLYNQIF